MAETSNPLAPARPNVTFTGPDGTSLHGYLATPAGSNRLPAVLMIHEWWGLNADTALLADALAAQGFVVLAADAFRGSVASDREAARKQTTETPRERIAADLDAALAWLRAHARVDPAKVASLGFCFGGTQSMLMGTRRPELASVVIFYGSRPLQEQAQLGCLCSGRPVLGIYGAEDAGIPVEQVKTFEAALAAAGARCTITVYPGVGHAFVKSGTCRDGGTAQKAWEQAVGFLRETLGR
jgi:carboxymethylenebutenolidase